MFSRSSIVALALAAFGAFGSADAQSVDLTGAGATFPYPIYSKWFSEYAKNTGVKINYQSIGSGGGIKQLSAGTVDFGASDAPMTNTEIAGTKGGAVVHIPTVLGGVVVVYNIPGLSKPLNLTSDDIGNIFLGNIKKWNDKRIAKSNPGVTLPNRDVLVVHRSDGSGTTYVFTDYLTSANAEWADGPGRGKEVKWPVGLGGKGNEGVAGQVKQIPGAIGYVELAYAKQNKLAFANVRNSSGKFITPTMASITAAAEGALKKAGKRTDYRISVANSSSPNAYPIASYTWLLVYKQQTNSVKAKKLLDFVRWAITDGEKLAESLDYAPLPDVVTADLLNRVLPTITVAK